MSSQTRLNGSKVLKGAAAFALLLNPEKSGAPLQLSKAIAEAEINLPYVTLTRDKESWVVTLAVEGADKSRMHSLLKESPLGELLWTDQNCMILSLFPHQSNPRVPAMLFEAFGSMGIMVEGAANSPSALSLILSQDLLDKISALLFDVFQFSTYSTPEEWKEAQKGKEVLYKEVVASYQEKHPKVYGLNCFENQGFVIDYVEDPTLRPISGIMDRASDKNLRLSLFTSCPSKDKSRTQVNYCLPIHSLNNGSAASADIAAAVFSMNGPHFGDRYGITSELLAAFNKKEIEILALNCTVASITGAIKATDIDPAIEAIQGCFEVPTVFRV
jgi:aspartokinase